MAELKNNNNKERLIDEKELAELIGMSLAFIVKARREYNLPYYKFGRSVRFKPSEVFEWTKERKVV